MANLTQRQKGCGLGNRLRPKILAGMSSPVVVYAQLREATALFRDSSYLPWHRQGIWHLFLLIMITRVHLCSSENRYRLCA